jgi:hypothetical protein
MTDGCEGFEKKDFFFFFLRSLTWGQQWQVEDLVMGVVGIAVNFVPGRRGGNLHNDKVCVTSECCPCHASSPRSFWLCILGEKYAEWEQKPYIIPYQVFTAKEDEVL